MRSMRRIRSESGVAEVVGTILILAMTVVLFASIIIWVASFPTPQASIRLDMNGQLTLLSPTGVNITVTHRGGETLEAFRTIIFFTVEEGGTSETEVLRTRGVTTIAYGLADGSDDDWHTGERWMYTNHSVSHSARVTITVVDTIRSLILWTGPLLGAAGDHPPIFLEKWLDGDVSTPLTRDIPQTGRTFGIYARVADQDGDLKVDNVTATFLFGPGGTYRLFDDGTHGDAVASDGIFSRTDAGLIPQTSWDGGIVIVRAEDLAGHTTESRLIFEVVEGPGTTPTSGREGPFDLFFISEFQAYEIYNATAWDTLKWNANGTREFKKGEVVVVIVASQYLKNLELQNDFMMYDPFTVPPNPIIYQNVNLCNDPTGDPTATTKPSSTNAFEFLEFASDFYVYELRFSTDSTSLGFDGKQLCFGHYSLDITLRANNVPPPRNRFATVDAITVTDENGEVPDYPKLEFFKDAAHTQPSSEFNFTDILYVRVTVLDTDANPDDVTAGDVVMSDFIGGIQIWTTPGNPPISSVAQNNSETYSFEIDLSKPNRDPWIFGRNSYGFRLKLLEDTNELYALSSQVVVRGPRWNLDVITGLQEFSHPVFDEKWFAAFYDNDRLWTQYLVESFKSEPSLFCPEFGCSDFLDVAYGDLDEDGDLDAVFGLELGTVQWYRNTLGRGHAWERFEIDNVGSQQVTAVAIGTVDRDSDNDVVSGTSGGEVWFYDNDGQWTPNLVDNVGTSIEVVKLADIDADGDNDLVVGYGSTVHVYLNDGTGLFGTIATTDYLLASDIDVEGIVSGTVTDTQASDDAYESIQEVLGTGEVVEVYTAQDDWEAVHGTVVSGTFTATHVDDGIFHILREELFSPDPGPNDHRLLRNSTAGDAPGHTYFFGNVPALAANDTATITIRAFLSIGTEEMAVAYGVGGDADPVTTVGTIVETSATTKTFTLTGFTGGDLYISIKDTDASFNDGSSDSTDTEIQIDLLEVRVTRESGETSRLEHRWLTQTIGTGGDAYKVFIEAHRTINGEADDFLFQWATDESGPWSDLVVVSKTSDNNLYQTANLPISVGGNAIYLRVIDTNRTPDATEIDTIFIDHVFIRRFVSVPNFETISVGATVRDLVVADINDDGDRDIVLAAGTNARIYYGRNWATTESLDGSSNVLAVDVGFIDADTLRDIVIGTEGDRVFWFNQAASWARTEVANLGADVTTLRVGDVDGDFWDDIVLGTSNGYIRWFRNVGGSSWTDNQIVKLDTQIFAIDIGDVDRGVLIDPGA